MNFRPSGTLKLTFPRSENRTRLVFRSKEGFILINLFILRSFVSLISKISAIECCSICCSLISF